METALLNDPKLFTVPSFTNRPVPFNVPEFVSVAPELLLKRWSFSMVELTSLMMVPPLLLFSVPKIVFTMVPPFANVPESFANVPELLISADAPKFVIVVVESTFNVAGIPMSKV